MILRLRRRHGWLIASLFLLVVLGWITALTSRVADPIADALPASIADAPTSEPLNP
jgi:hypothetical protein